MSSPSTVQIPTPSTDKEQDTMTSSSSSNAHSNTAASSSLSPTTDAGSHDAQELSYFSSDPNQVHSEHPQMPNGSPKASGKLPGGRCYSREELMHLKKSPLVAAPSGMPPRKEWFGEYNEQASKPKDHDGLSTTRMRHRRDADSEDPTRPFDSTRPLFKSGQPQPSAMGSFRHQSFRDRGSDIDKDTANLKSIAERYDRERLGPLSPGIAGFTGRAKDRETAPHFNGKERDAASRFDAAAPRIGAVPRRAEGAREPRKKGDEVGDWRKNADPARERADTREREAKRETSRTRGDDDRRRRDRSRTVGEEEPRRWREDGTRDKERKGRDTSRNGDRRSRERGEEREVNGRHAKKKGEDEDRERAEANRRRKEERDKETPAWFDEDATPSSNGLKGFSGAGSGTMDELQKWKLEKKAKEEEKAREEREALNPSATGTGSHSAEHEHDQEPDTNVDEHKTPRPAKVQVNWDAAPPPPQPPVLFQTQGHGTGQSIASPTGSEGLSSSNPLDALKAMMGVSKEDASSANAFQLPHANGGMFSSATSSPLSSTYSNAVQRPPQSASAINYEAVGRSINSDFDPPAVSRHAFARGVTNPSPAPSDSNKSFDSVPGSGQPAGLRTIQSAEPSHRTRNIGDVHGHPPAPGSRSSRDSSPSHMDVVVPFGNRQPPPHMQHPVMASLMNQGGIPGLSPNGPLGGLNNMNTNNLDSTPLFHLPASAGAGAGPKDGSLNSLSVITPQSQQQMPPGMNMSGMGGNNGMGMGNMGMPTRTQNASPQQNLLARLGILQQERKPSPKMMDGNAPGTDLRMPMPQQHYGSGPPSASSASAMAMGRGAYGSPVDERFEPMSAVSGDGRFHMNQNQSQPQHQPGSSASSNYGPSPVGGSNPNLAHTLSAKGSRLAKFFENPRDGGVSPPHGHAGNMGGMNMMAGSGIQGRHEMVTPPSQYDGDKAGMSDLLALLQHGSQQQNRPNNAAQQQMYREEMLLRQREVLQQQQLREREARQLEQQQMYGQTADFFDSRGSFVSNDLVPGLRPPVQRAERDLYNSDRLDDRLAYAAHGRVPGVPGGGYDQMMRNMGINQPARGAGNVNAANMYSGLGGGQGGGLSGQLAAEILQQQQQQQLRERERQRQLQRQEMERARLMALQAQGGPLSARSSSSSLSAQLDPRQNVLEQFERTGRLGNNDIQAQQFGGYGGHGGVNGPNAAALGGMGLNGGFGVGNQLNGGFDARLRQQQLSLQQQQGVQQQRQVAGMGFGGVEPRYGQQAQLHGAGGGMVNQGGAQGADLMALLLAGHRGGQQN